MADIATSLAVGTSPTVAKTNRFRFGPLWLALPGALFILIFFAWPALQMMSISFFDKTGQLSFAAYAKMLDSSVYRRVLGTTFSIALQVTLWSVALGYPLACWLAGQSARRQRVLLMLVLLPFWTSALVKNFAWLVLLGRNGIVSEMMSGVGLSGDSLLFNRATVIFGMVHTMLPLTVITMMPVLNQIDRTLSSAAATLGAPPAQAFWRIHFHLSMRGVATAGLLVFVGSLGFFITPALLGSPQETLIGQLIIKQIQELQNWQFGSALAVVLVLTTLLTIFLFDRVFGISAIGGSGRPRASDGFFRRLGLRILEVLGAIFERVGAAYARNFRGLPAARLLDFYCWMLIGVLLFPILGFIPMAFTAGTFLSFPPQGLSLRWFETFLASPQWMAATTRSFGIGFVTAGFTLLISTLVAFGIVQSKSRLAGLAFVLFLAPMVVPSIVIAIALFYLFAQLHLVATDLAIIIGHSVIAMPIVFIVMLSTLKGHDWRLDQAASTLGAGRMRVALRVTLPLVKGGLVVGFITGFLQSFEELTVAMFTGGGLITTLPKQMWDDIQLQVNPTLAAASVVVLLVVTVLFIAMELLQPGQRTRA